MRYLTQGEVTWIGASITAMAVAGAGELADYYQFLDTALAPNAFDADQQSAQRGAIGLRRAQSGARLPGEAGVRALGWLYGASVSAMTNLNDGRSPEVSYTGFNNVELRARLIVLGGQS